MATTINAPIPSAAIINIMVIELDLGCFGDFDVVALGSEGIGTIKVEARRDARTNRPEAVS